MSIDIDVPYSSFSDDEDKDHGGGGGGGGKVPVLLSFLFVVCYLTKQQLLALGIMKIGLPLLDTTPLHQYYHNIMYWLLLLFSSMFPILSCILFLSKLVK